MIVGRDMTGGDTSHERPAVELNVLHGLQRDWGQRGYNCSWL